MPLTRRFWWAWFLGTCLVGLAGPAGAATKWYDLYTTTKEVNTLTNRGGAITWTSTSSGEDSLAFVCQTECVCDNTHATTDWTIYRVNETTGAKLASDWWKAPAATNCSDTTSVQCSTVTLAPGKYIIDPDTNTTASSQCRSKVDQ